MCRHRRSGGPTNDGAGGTRGGLPAIGGAGVPPGGHRVPPDQHSTSRGEEGVSVTAETEGRVYNVAGQDWDEVVAAAEGNRGGRGAPGRQHGAAAPIHAR